MAAPLEAPSALHIASALSGSGHQPVPTPTHESGPSRTHADSARGLVSGPWVWLSTAAALTAAAGSVTGLRYDSRIYGGETETLADAATAQDLVNLFIVAPLLVLLAVRARSGSLRAYLAWLGCLSFTAYNYAIYAFSIHFGPLFLPWVLVLGLSFYALLGALATTDLARIKGQFSGRPIPLAAWTLIAFAAAFMLLWLSEILPDLASGGSSRSAARWAIPTNPVHVLDLAFFLPAVMTTGVLLLRRHRLGYATAPGQLVFLALTCLPILVTPFVASRRGHDAGWAVLAPIVMVFAVASIVLWRILANAEPRNTAADR